MTLLNNNVDYVKLIAKKRKKRKIEKLTENILFYKKNKQLRKFLRNDEIKTQLT